jgi:hypothetical protein
VPPDEAPPRPSRPRRSRPVTELLDELATTDAGLDPTEARARLAKHGARKLVAGSVAPVATTVAACEAIR